MLGAQDPCVGVRVLSYDILLLIKELRCAEAALIIYQCHKTDIDRWVKLKACLFRQASSHREFSFLADLIHASCQSDLSQSVTLVPGLSNLILRDGHVSSF